MRIIISHVNLDFDGLASMVAASKIYPDAIMVFTGKLNKGVKEFYSLYKNVLHIKQASDIDINKVTGVIIVDTNSINRLGKFRDLQIGSVDVNLYDHHLESENTIERGNRIIKPYGSCTAILVEEIIRKQIVITPFEATLFVLGIYTDTNCLTFPNTTPEDAEIVGYLLRKGADLEITTEHIQKSLSDEHHQLFLSLLLNMENIEVNNYKIILSTYKCDTYIGELSYIASKMLEIKDCDAVFLVVEMEKRYYIVGRSLDDNINIPFILEEFKGAGHLRAASAAVKFDGIGDLGKVKETLMRNLHHKIKPQITARDIMNYPVKTITKDVTIEEASKIMLRYGHTGIPVVEDDELIGIISRTDIDKATIHGLIHAPVKGFMKGEVKTVGPETSLNTINDLLVSNNIGRLPVIENNKMIGIVTRTDLLRMLHGKNQPYWYKRNFSVTEEILNCYEKIKNIPPAIYSILEIIGETGDLLNKNVYIVGGFVRDLLLGIDNSDLDFVIEGDGIAFAQELNKKLQGELVLHEKFATASIKLGDGNVLDIVSARREYYHFPAALPQIEKSSLWNDLFRRDFTLNCMAIQINKESFGRLIDYFGGLEDIENKQIRVLYNLSFVEDPTRIFRAVRFSSRLGFKIESETKKFIIEAVKNNLINKVSDDRVREEIAYIITEKHLCRSIVLMRDFDIFTALHCDLNISTEIVEKLDSIQESIDYLSGVNTIEVNKKIIIVLQLLGNFPTDKLPQIIYKFICNKDAIAEIQVALEEKNIIYTLLQQEDLDKFVLYNALQKHRLESLIFFYNDCKNPYIKHYINYYMLHLKDIKVHLSGKDLLALDIIPGPIYGEILQSILECKVKGAIHNKNDEIKHAKVIYENLKERYDV
ncbi:MAG: CBS domain-containing protein [Clostridiaceae bacterium]|nr:CBS domain-containing protein [Clostridiaceae bacterium]